MQDFVDKQFAFDTYLPGTPRQPGDISDMFPYHIWGRGHIPVLSTKAAKEREALRRRETVHRRRTPSCVEEACAYGNLSYLVLLYAQGKLDVLARKAVYEGSDASALMWAAFKGHLPIVKFLVNIAMNECAKLSASSLSSDGPNSSSSSSNAHHDANYAVQQAAFSRFINYQSALGHTALQWATISGKTGIVRFLLDHNADPAHRDRQGFDAAFAAVQNDQLAILLLLLEDSLAAGAITLSSSFADAAAATAANKTEEPPQQHVTVAVNQSVGSHNFPEDDELSEEEQRAIALNEDDGRVYIVHHEKLRALNDVAKTRRHPCPPSSTNNNKNSTNLPSGPFAIVRTNFYHLDPSLRDVEGHNLLHWTAYRNSPAACQYLINRWQYNVNVQDLHGRTPIIWAAREGFSEVVEYLCLHGADRDFYDKDGLSALQYAMVRNHPEAAYVLRNAPAVDLVALGKEEEEESSADGNSNNRSSVIHKQLAQYTSIRARRAFGTLRLILSDSLFAAQAAFGALYMFLSYILLALAPPMFSYFPFGIYFFKNMLWMIFVRHPEQSSSQEKRDIGKEAGLASSLAESVRGTWRFRLREPANLLCIVVMMALQMFCWTQLGLTPFTLSLFSFQFLFHPLSSTTPSGLSLRSSALAPDPCRAVRSHGNTGGGGGDDANGHYDNNNINNGGDDGVNGRGTAARQGHVDALDMSSELTRDRCRVRQLESYLSAHKRHYLTQYSHRGSGSDGVSGFVEFTSTSTSTVTPLAGGAFASTANGMGGGTRTLAGDESQRMFLGSGANILSEVTNVTSLLAYKASSVVLVAEGAADGGEQPRRYLAADALFDSSTYLGGGTGPLRWFFGGDAVHMVGTVLPLLFTLTIVLFVLTKVLAGRSFLSYRVSNAVYKKGEKAAMNLIAGGYRRRRRGGYTAAQGNAHGNGQQQQQQRVGPYYEEGSLSRSPIWRILKSRQYNWLHPRALLLERHTQIPARAFYCPEQDVIVHSYDGYSILLDCPIGASNHLFFVLGLTCFTLFQLCLFSWGWHQMHFFTGMSSSTHCQYESWTSGLIDGFHLAQHRNIYVDSTTLSSSVAFGVESVEPALSIPSAKAASLTALPAAVAVAGDGEAREREPQDDATSACFAAGQSVVHLQWLNQFLNVYLHGLPRKQNEYIRRSLAEPHLRAPDTYTRRVFFLFWYYWWPTPANLSAALLIHFSFYAIPMAAALALRQWSGVWRGATRMELSNPLTPCSTFGGRLVAIFLPVTRLLAYGRGRDSYFDPEVVNAACRSDCSGNTVFSSASPAGAVGEDNQDSGHRGGASPNTAGGDEAKLYNLDLDDEFFYEQTSAARARQPLPDGAGLLVKSIYADSQWALGNVMYFLLGRNGRRWHGAMAVSASLKPVKAAMLSEF